MIRFLETAEGMGVFGRKKDEERIAELEKELAGYKAQLERVNQIKHDELGPQTAVAAEASQSP